MRTLGFLLKYSLTDFLRSHRYFPPLAAYVVIIAVAYSAPRPIPVWGSYAFTATVLFILSGWMTLAFTGTESPIARDIIRTHAGGSWSRNWYQPVGICTVTGVLALYGVLFPWVFWVHGRLPLAREILIPLLGHMGAGILGVGIALNFSQGLVKNLSKAWGGLAIIWTLTLSQPGIAEMLPKTIRPVLSVFPPMNPLIKTTMALDARTYSGNLTAAALASLACAAYGIAVSWIAVRRAK